MKNIIFIISNFLFTYTHAGICKPNWCDETDGVTQNDGICSCKTSDLSTDWVLCGNGQYGKFCKAYSGDGIQGCMKEPLCTNTDRTQENTNACLCKNGVNFDLCNSDTGLFCKMSDWSSVDNVCFSTLPPPICSDEKGYTKILAPCTCGVQMPAMPAPTLCAIDQYCKYGNCGPNNGECGNKDVMTSGQTCKCLNSDINVQDPICTDGQWCNSDTKLCSSDTPPVSSGGSGSGGSGRRRRLENIYDKNGYLI